MKHNIKKHFTLIAPSTGGISGVALLFPGGSLTLRFDYDKDGTVFKSALIFDKVRAHHHETEMYCPAWKIRASYDKLVEIQNSPWVDDLRDGIPEDLKNAWQLNHYMIYFDSDGCFEVIADSWSIKPEEEGSWE